MERLDADLLELTEIDRDTGTIWFVYDRPLTTREELPGELRRLQGLGWIERTSKGRWTITGAGSEALSAARNWVLQVDEISHDQEDSQAATLTGRLIAGSMAFFAHPYCNGFTIRRDDATEGTGWVNGIRPTDDVADPYVVVSLEFLESDRLQHGDLLCFRQQWLG